MLNKKKIHPAETILVITIGFLIISLIIEKKWPAYVSVVVGLAGIFSSGLAELINKAWMKLAEILGMIVPNILLTLVFFLFLFPLALLSKLISKKDLLHLKQPAAGNYVDIQKKFEKKMFDHPW